MPWVAFHTMPVDECHEAVISNPEDKPVKDMRSRTWPKASIERGQVFYGTGAVTLRFARPTQGEVAL